LVHAPRRQGGDVEPSVVENALLIGKDPLTLQSGFDED